MGMSVSSTPLNVAIFVYDQAEVLDFAGPFEVFSTANRLASPSPFCVFLVSEAGESITARGGFSVMPKFNFDNHPPVDLLIVVGGVHTAEMNKPNVLNWISNTATAASLTASVCTGVFLLAAAGVVTAQMVTTHWEDIADLRLAYPQLTVKENSLWVDAGAIVSSAGISAGIAMSLHLVRRLHSTELALKTARQMEFDWQP